MNVFSKFFPQPCPAVPWRNSRDVPLAALDEQGILDQHQVDSKAILLSPTTEVEELPQAVSVDDDIHVIETVSWIHHPGGLEDWFERMLGYARGILVNELQPSVCR